MSETRYETLQDFAESLKRKDEYKAGPLDGHFDAAIHQGEVRGWNDCIDEMVRRGLLRTPSTQEGIDGRKKSITS